jgi:hypothetical protein
MTQNREELQGSENIHTHMYNHLKTRRNQLNIHTHLQWPKNKEKPDQLSIHTVNQIPKAKQAASI